MIRYVIEDQDTGSYWSRGDWWYSIDNATIYKTAQEAEEAGEKYVEKRGVKSRIVKVLVIVSRID
jgi:hypothetical protein